MTTPTKTPARTVDRQALALRILDNAISHPSLDYRDSLDDWFSVIDGIARYLRVSTDPAPKDGPVPFDVGAYAAELATVADVILKAAKIARELARAAIEEART